MTIWTTTWSLGKGLDSSKAKLTELHIRRQQPAPTWEDLRATQAYTSHHSANQQIRYLKEQMIKVQTPNPTTTTEWSSEKPVTSTIRAQTAQRNTTFLSILILRVVPTTTVNKMRKTSRWSQSVPSRSMLRHKPALTKNRQLSNSTKPTI